MLTQETKRHIDAARQVLVGVVPNPSSQIDQITNALIYKFMDDMDQSAIKAGGDPSFFVGDLERYAWTRLMDSRLGNQERMNLYSEALVKFSEAKQLPPLFRDIFKSAFLPYRSPEVLGLFLKEIDYFDYSHSEELGNAYEYLLSIMGSQGDAGQFRTPRHIIDFIVEAVNPTKDDKVLDPACGTAGFLVSAYKHILEQHDGKNADGSKNNEKPLTPDQRKAIMNNFEGYDVDPGMVRISQVNMYLHHFRNPKIFNYNTLSQDERWADKFDVILANPPFMSPKGGVSTHNKFSVPSSRSEVLFVDYIMNHLRPKGRAGIIVPEGIIFQSGSAHKQLRKNLIEDGLYAVVSLPSGVFQPYSGVKTSILLFNNELAKQNAEILFVKVENDGFDLGATKRPINKNDLPQALEIITAWKLGKKLESKLALYTEKAKIIESGDYNLSGDRYRVAKDYANAKWPMMELGEICEIYQPKTITSKEIKEKGKYKVFGANGVIGYFDEYNHEDSEVAITCRGATCGTVNFTEPRSWITGNAMVVQPKSKNLNKRFLFYLLRNTDLSSVISGAAQPQITGSALKPFKIPIPPFDVQEQIVAELDGYQKIISGARQIVENWSPDIKIPKEVGMVKVGSVVDFVSGVTLAIGDCENETGVPIITIADVAEDGSLKLENLRKVKTDKNVNVLQKGDLLFNWRNGSKDLVGKTAYFDLDGEYIFASFLLGIRPKKELIESKFLWFLLNKYRAEGKYLDFMRQNVNGLFNREELKDVEIPLPPLTMQKDIIEEIESERKLVKSSKKLVEIYEQKTKDVLSKLWSE